MKNELKCTKNYELFRFEEVNRPVNLEKHKALVASMKKYGFIKGCPLIVKRKNEKFVILDGQHRFQISKNMGLPVYYVQEDKDINIPELNSTAVRWSISTYIESYARAGINDYRAILDYRAKYHLPITLSAMMLSNSFCAKGVFDRLKSGTYRVGDCVMAERVGVVISDMAKHYKKAKTKNFVDAVCVICRMEGIDLERLVNKFRTYNKSFVNHADREGILGMLEDVYNHRSKAGTLYSIKISAKNMALKARRRQ